MANTVKGTLRTSFLLNGQSKGAVDVDAEYDGGKIFEGDLLASQTNKQITVAFPVASGMLKMYWIMCDQDITLKFNSSGTPAPTMTLLAGQSHFFYLAGPFANEFSVDVTTAYYTSGVNGGHLTIYAIYDATP